MAHGVRRGAGLEAIVDALEASFLQLGNYDEVEGAELFNPRTGQVMEKEDCEKKQKEFATCAFQSPFAK